VIKYIVDAEKFSKITGFRQVSVDNKEEFLRSVRKTQMDLTIQFFDADLVCTWEHLLFAAMNSLAAFRNDTNISKRPDIEMLLYASAHRQISKAIKLIGIKADSANIALVAIGSSRRLVEESTSGISSMLRTHPDDSILELTQEKTNRIKEIFQITEQEIASVMKEDCKNQALVDLVIERMALLPTQI
jgi:KEOPS complex subunit Cgi121